MTKKLLVILLLLTISTPSFAASDGAYEEVECSIDAVFSENSCNQCFNWWTKLQWDNLGLLSDLWMNVTNVDKILYKEEQVDPEMINLDSDSVIWNEVPWSEWFWEYTDEFNALYSDTEEWYVLKSGKSVTWIQSNLSNAYNLAKNAASAGTNIWLLKYPIATHNILADWEITIDSAIYNECVLFKSWDSATDVPEEEIPQKLPETWPADYILLLVAAMLLGLWILKFRTTKS